MSGGLPSARKWAVTTLHQTVQEHGAGSRFDIPPNEPSSWCRTTGIVATSHAGFVDGHVEVSSDIALKWGSPRDRGMWWCSHEDQRKIMVDNARSLTFG